VGVPPDNRDLCQGLIHVGIARCIGIALAWTGPTSEDNERHLILEVITLIVQVILFEPGALLFIVVISQGTNRDVDISNTTSRHAWLSLLAALLRLQLPLG